MTTPADIQPWFGQATNNGLKFVGNAATPYYALSDHATAAYRPKLVVEYTEAAAGFKPTGAVTKGIAKPPVGAQTNTGTIGRNVGKPLSGGI
jgi:hypothetical protein